MRTIERMKQISRRVLLAGSAALAAAAKPEMVRLPRRVRLGIIGFDGHVGDIIGPLPRIPDIEVVAICDADPSATAKAAKNPRLSAAKRYTDYREMLEREKLDLVAVCNNNGERDGAIQACAKRNLNVIAEKPLAIHRRDLDLVRQAVSEHKIALGMLLPMRFEPAYLALKKLAADGVVGEVAQIDAQKSYKAGDRAAWYKKRSTYGGTIAWIGIHMIDLMRWTSGREFVETASLQGHVAFPQLGEMENVTTSMFRLDNGGTATLRMDYLRPESASSHGDDRLRLAGTNGVIEYTEATGVTILEAGQKPRVMSELPAGGSVFVDYLEATYNGKAPGLPVADIWRVNEITLAAQEAADRRVFVRCG